jgi:hypothetical protein
MDVPPVSFGSALFSVTTVIDICVFSKPEGLKLIELLLSSNDDTPVTVQI